MENARERAIQWCLDEGHGIEYSAEKGGVTTQAELDAADKADKLPRYVNKETAAFWIEGAENDAKIQYTIENNLSLLDYDEWDATCRALGVEISWEDSSKINEIFYEKYDYTPLEAPDYNADNTSIAAAFGFDEPENRDSENRLRGNDAQAIYDIIQKYPEAEQFKASDILAVELDAREEAYKEIGKIISEEWAQYESDMKNAGDELFKDAHGYKVIIESELEAWANYYQSSPEESQLQASELQNFIKSKKVFKENLIDQVKDNFLGCDEPLPLSYETIDYIVTAIATQAEIEKENASKQKVKREESAKKSERDDR